MKPIKYFSASLFLLMALTVSCSSDPWETGNKYPNDTNNVVITKTTKYGTQDDGISPYKSKVGSVTMSHKTHADKGLACIDCHHKHDNDAREKKCAVCHNGQKGYERLHGKCLDCHIAKNGPQHCKQCH